MKKRYVGVILAALICSNADAGFRSLTWHSRANCLTINESFTWDATHYHWLYTESNHEYYDVHDNYIDNDKVTDMTRYTWRSGGFHIGELAGSGRYLVNGTHMEKVDGKIKMLEYTKAKDCNLYDGWWDHDHPERKS